MQNGSYIFGCVSPIGRDENDHSQRHGPDGWVPACCRLYPWLVCHVVYSSSTMHPQTHRSLSRAREFMRHSYNTPVSLPDVAAQANLSPYHFLRIYKHTYRETPHEFLTRLRIERAKTLLTKGNHNVTEACFEVGFSSLGSFSTMFAQRVGLSPSEYRRFARSSISVPAKVRQLFVPSCFFTMLYGTPEERNFREAGKMTCG